MRDRLCPGGSYWAMKTCLSVLTGPAGALGEELQQL